MGYLCNRPDSLRDQTPDFNEAVLAYVRSHHVPQVILCARWSLYDHEGLEEALQRTLRELEQAGCTTWFVRQVPDQRDSVPRLLLRAAARHLDPSSLATTRRDYENRTAYVEKLLQLYRQPHLHVIDPTPFFFDQGEPCRLLVQGRCLYRDDTHLTPFGARQLVYLFDPIFAPENDSPQSQEKSDSATPAPRP